MGTIYIPGAASTSIWLVRLADRRQELGAGGQDDQIAAHVGHWPAGGDTIPAGLILIFAFFGSMMPFHPTFGGHRL